MNDRNLEEMKQAYEKPRMSKEQIEIMKKRIDEAKMENSVKNKILTSSFVSDDPKFADHGNNNKHIWKGIAVAAVIATFIILPNTSASVAHAMENIPILGKLVEVVTFRDYKYEDERNRADIEIPELVPQTITQGNQVSNDEAVLQETVETLVQEEGKTEAVQENLKKTTEEINAEIQEITGKFVEEFKENLQYDWGYQDVIVKSEAVNTTQEYFTLKLICYQGAGSGAEWNYFFTIDLNTGERLQLRDLFKEGADYITPISENIKTQMREQMEADDMKHYWLEDEIEECNFKQITDETAFYLNEEGNIVISFSEGDVAPMYMGCVEFVIPDEVVADIVK